MTDTFIRTSNMMDLEFVVSDADTITESALRSGLELCVEKMRLPGVDAAAARLRKGDRQVHSYFEYGLTKRLAKHLSELDDEVQAVYLYDADATPDDIAFTESAPTIIRVIVRARRKTGALTSLLAALERAFSTSYAERLGEPDVTHLLHLQVVDDAEISEGTAYGMLLTSLHLPPLAVWKR